MSKYTQEQLKKYRTKQAPKMAGYQVEYRNRRRRLIHDMKKQVSCVYCGLINPLCIDFDHIDRSTKKHIPSKMVTGGHRWECVLEEISKCQPVCANCHRMKTILEDKKMSAVDDDIYQYMPSKLLEEFNITFPTDSSKAQLEVLANTSIRSS